MNDEPGVVGDFNRRIEIGKRRRIGRQDRLVEGHAAGPIVVVQGINRIGRTADRDVCIGWSRAWNHGQERYCQVRQEALEEDREQANKTVCPKDSRDDLHAIAARQDSVESGLNVRGQCRGGYVDAARGVLSPGIGVG